MLPALDSLVATRLFQHFTQVGLIGYGFLEATFKTSVVDRCGADLAKTSILWTSCDAGHEQIPILTTNE